MSLDENSNKIKEIDVEIQNKIDNNSNNNIDLVSSEQRIVDNFDSSISESHTSNNNNSILNNIKEINNSKKNNSELVFGIPYEIKYPKKIGNLIAFLYLKNTPLIVLSKDCKYAPLILNIL